MIQTIFQQINVYTYTEYIRWIKLLIYKCHKMYNANVQLKFWYIILLDFDVSTAFQLSNISSFLIEYVVLLLDLIILTKV